MENEPRSKGLRPSASPAPQPDRPWDIDPVKPALHCWYLTGPTASGKTEVGLELAEQLGAEIVSMDSMAVYRGMDIGTAKPSAAERQRVPHHLLDLVDPDVEFSVSEYVNAAHRALADIESRGKQVLFVGGTSLYLKSLLRGIYQGPPADWEFRSQVEREVERVGVAALHERLQQVDPLSAARLHPNDKRRIIRALEVYKNTGRPLSHQQQQFDEGRPAECVKVFVLGWPRDELHRRIDARVDRMFEAGLVAEVESLLARFQKFGRTASQAVGYREVVEYLQQRPGGPDGEALEETCASVKSRTRQFARRQETWFRSLSECRRIERSEPTQPAQIARQIIALAAEAPGLKRDWKPGLKWEP